MICALVLGTLSPNNGDMHVGNFNNFGNQCPSFFDLDMFMDKASGFHYFSNQKVKINWREFLSPNLRQQIRLSPANLIFDISVSSCDKSGKCNDGVFFEFAKAP